MSTHEGFKVLSRGEYDAQRDQRVIEHDINQGQIYTAMFALTEGDAEAASNPINVAEKKLCLHCGKTAMKIAILDAHLKPVPDFIRGGKIVDGLWVPSQHFRFATPITGTVGEVYLADYDDGGLWDLFAAVDSSKELVGAGSASTSSYL